MKRSIIFSLLLTILFTSFIFSQIPLTISYQGVLLDANGDPVPDGSYNLGFKLYDVATGGTALWSESQSQTITNGVVNVILGSVNPLNLPFDKTYWLGISINQGTELSPRIRLTSSAYSLNARTVSDGSITSSKIADNSITTTKIQPNIVSSVNGVSNDGGNIDLVAGNSIKITPNDGDKKITIDYTGGGNGAGNTLDQAYDQGGPGAGRTITADAGPVLIAGAGESEGLVVDGKLGIGVSNPEAKLDVKYWPQKQLRLQGIGATGYWNIFHNADGINDYGLSFADNTGTEWFALNRLSYEHSIYLRDSVGIGTYHPKGNLHIASTGDTKLRFSNGDNHEATIVYDMGNDGLEFRMGKTGDVPTFFMHDNGNIGIGTVSPNEKLQVAGIIHSTSGGYKFPDGSVQTTAATGNGTIPDNSITSAKIKDGTIQGVDINSSTTINVGKLQAGGTTSSTVGVYGKSSNYGVFAENSYSDKYGALATLNHGVYGHGGSSGNYAGYFYGNVYISGNLIKGGGSFKIDHPLDPENKYLSHSFVESPDMMNIYNGNVVLNEKGEAAVELPDWFGALNSDFCYQLTAVGTPGPNLYIAQEISNNRFKIAGGSSGMKVSWQVTGIRQDAYANANRIPVEEMKKGEERGKYLHPEVFNQPETMGIDYAERQKAEHEMK